jgi:hypothetical protein
LSALLENSTVALSDLRRTSFEESLRGVGTGTVLGAQEYAFTFDWTRAAGKHYEITGSFCEVHRPVYHVIDIITTPTTTSTSVLFLFLFSPS